MIAEGNHCDSHFASKSRAAVRLSANTSGNLSDIYGTMIAEGNHCDSHFAAKGRAAVRLTANTSGNLSDV